MVSVVPINVKPLRTPPLSREVVGETAILIAEGLQIHLGLASIIPRQTMLRQLVSVDETHLYELTVHDYTVGEFIAVALAFAEGDIDAAAMLIDDLCPSHLRT